MKKKEKLVWARKTFKALMEYENIEFVDFYAGKNYREFLIPKLQGQDIECGISLKDMSFGQQLQFLKKQGC